MAVTEGAGDRIYFTEDFSERADDARRQTVT